MHGSQRRVHGALQPHTAELECSCTEPKRFLLLTTYYLLLATCYLLLPTYDLLLPTYYLLLTFTEPKRFERVAEAWGSRTVSTMCGPG